METEKSEREKRRHDGCAFVLRRVPGTGQDFFLYVLTRSEFQLGGVFFPIRVQHVAIV